MSIRTALRWLSAAITCFSSAGSASAVPDHLLALVGSHPNSASPYGTFDQGGNSIEWIDEIISGSSHRRLGGGFNGSDPSELSAQDSRAISLPTGDPFVFGFRVA